MRARSYKAIMITKWFCGILLFFATTSVWAQKEGNFWYFGDYAAIDFNSGEPLVLNNSQMYQREGCASISDSIGNLLFYTNGIRVWNRKGLLMGIGQLLAGGQSATQSALIAKKPGVNSLYFIFTIPDPDISGINGLKYTVIDMTLNDSLGDFTQVVNSTMNVAPTEEKITAVKHANNKDIWIITHTWNSDAFYAFLLTDQGIDKDRPVISNSGMVHTGNFIKMAGYIKASPDGSKLAIITRTNSNLQLFDFDNQTGIISNPITFHPSYNKSYGLEFSPSGNMLYLSDYSNHAKIIQFDLSLPPAQIISSGIDIGFVDNHKIGALQVAPNGVIYVAKFDTMEVGFISDKYLGSINYPEKRGLACGFIEDDIFLSSGGSNLGLPTFVQSYFFKQQDFRFDEVCAGDNVEFSLTNEKELNSVLWDFGDPESGTENQSDLLNPSHVFANGGTYQVTLISYFNTNTDTLIKSITIYPNPDVDLGNDTSFCSNDPVLLIAGTNENDYLWQNNSHDSSYLVSSSGFYWVEATNTYGCRTSDSVTLIQVESPNVFLGNDTVINVGDRLNLQVDPSYQNILWSDGSSGNELWVSQPGKYWVCAENHGCYASDTLLVSFDSHCRIFCPNTISPNGDGLNDNFQPFSNEELSSFHLIIVNRWGTIVFESDDIFNTWNGQYQGVLVKQGVFSFKIEYVCLYSDEKKVMSGTITVIR